MRPHISLVLTSSAFLPVSSWAHRDDLDHHNHHGHRNIGKAAPSVFEESSSTDSVSPISTDSESCEPQWSDWWYPGVGRSTTTTTITIIAPAEAESSNVSLFPSESGESTSTTTTTITIPASPDFSGVSVSPVDSSQLAGFSLTSLEETTAQTTFSDASSSATTANTSSGFVQTTPSASNPSPPYSNITVDCPTEPFNKTNMTTYFGFNVVNTKPSNLQPPAGYKTTTEDWHAAFALLKQNFGDINAVRMYSTTDGSITHLMNAMPAARNHSLSILVGVWSSGANVNDSSRFELERAALDDVFSTYGCGNIAAISVGNEDLNQVNVNNQGLSEGDKDGVKQAVANNLLDQISTIRKMTRDHGCCNIPITHTDTWNEFSDTSKPWIPSLIRAVDQATIVNIFPYWSQAEVTSSWEMMAYQSNLTFAKTKEFGKDVWLGETGWATSQPQNVASDNEHGTSKADAQQYFNQVGCQILSGNGTGFYYVDWDEDAPSQQKPAFGLFDYTGKPLLDSIDCSTFKADMKIKDYVDLPAFMGGSQARR